MGDEIANIDGRIAEIEELIYARYQSGHDQANDPCSDGGNGHVGVVSIGDGGTNLGIGRVIFKSDVGLIVIGIVVVKVLVQVFNDNYRGWIRLGWTHDKDGNGPLLLSPARVGLQVTTKDLSSPVWMEEPVVAALERWPTRSRR